MLTVLTWLSVALAQDAAEYPESSAERGRSMRPLTYPANPALSQGKVDNFFTLYVDPSALAATLKPKQEDRTASTGSLPIVNRTMGWQEVTVDGTKIGVIGPLTTGAIHGVKSGEYVVKMTNSTGYTSTTRVLTTNQMPDTVVPGNADAATALDATWEKPGFSPTAVTATEPVQVQGYRLPTPPPPPNEP